MILLSAYPLSIFFIFFIIWTIVFIIAILLTYKINKDDWNNGYCECGSKWIITTEEANGIIYRCSKCKNMHIQSGMYKLKYKDEKN